MAAIRISIIARDSRYPYRSSVVGHRSSVVGSILIEDRAHLGQTVARHAQLDAARDRALESRAEHSRAVRCDHGWDLLRLESRTRHLRLELRRELLDGYPFHIW